MRAKLTKRTIDALPRPEPNRRLYVWDTELTGLGLIYHGSGNRKVFVVAYGPKAARRRMSLGAYGPITVDKARELARAAIAKARQGGRSWRGAPPTTGRSHVQGVGQRVPRRGEAPEEAPGDRYLASPGSPRRAGPPGQGLSRDGAVG